MRSRINRLVFFEILFFAIYLIICSIPEYTLEKHLKFLLILSFLSLSIIFSLATIIYMSMRREIIYTKIAIACIPIMYLLAIFISVKIR